MRLPLLLIATNLAAQQPAPTLQTRWAADVKATNVLPEYPRPQLRRAAWINLNGAWDYALSDSGAKAVRRYDGTILVPFPIESQLSGVRRAVTPSQRLWYHRRFRATPPPRGGHWLLHFGAVDWDAVVIVNGRRVGEHRGGYDPFTFDITRYLHPSGEQDLVVNVWDPSDSGGQPRGKQMLRPHSIWYTAVTGIWQTVWLEAVPAAYIDDVSIVPDLAGERVRVTVHAAGTAKPATVEVVASAGDQAVARGNGTSDSTLTLALPHPHPWSPDDPFLYTLRIRLAGGDSATSYFGMRSIAVGKDAAGTLRLLLNGRALFEYGLLDQGFWPDGIYTAPTEAARRADLTTIKRLGFNLLRKHVKVEPERWYYLCDSLGILVWQDMPSVEHGNTTPAGRAGFEDELHRMISALKNHPSIVMWVPFNEGWGQYDTPRIVAWLKQTDPSRLVDNASGWTDAHVGDVSDLHDYPGPGIPDPDSARALVLGEFGGLGLPLEGHTWVQRESWGYRRFDSLDSLGAAYRNLMVLLRSLEQRGLAAGVYTQLSDVEREVNGIMTYDRAVVKLPADAPDLHRALYAPVSQGGSVTREHFGTTPDSQDVDAYTLANGHGMTLRVLTYGAIIQSLRVPDAHGHVDDVVLGFDSLAGYVAQSPYFGAVVGRYANRIAKGRFTLDGKTYQLATNNGANHLHGGVRGFDKVVWQAAPFQHGDSVGVKLTYLSPDGDQGYPGAVTIHVTYTLTTDNRLQVDYAATSTQATPFNVSQHSYWNLGGEGSGDILKHVLWIDADRYTPVDSTLIPTGALAPVGGTPFDFRTPTAIGARIEQPNEQLKFGRGYDHNWVLNRMAGDTGLVHAARLEEPASGRTLDVYTTEPGLQFYSGNFLDGTIHGIGGHVYVHRGALCLETQHFPDSPNHPNFPSTILRPGTEYRSRTVFAFGTRP